MKGSVDVNYLLLTTVDSDVMFSLYSVKVQIANIPLLRHKMVLIEIHKGIHIYLFIYWGNGKMDVYLRSACILVVMYQSVLRRIVIRIIG